jgi:hypothetical protein
MNNLANRRSGLTSQGHATPLMVVQTTVPITLRCFFKGQLKWLKSLGFEVHAVSSPGQELEHVAREEGAEVHAVRMTRRISPAADLVALIRLVLLYRRLRPQIVHGFTPKGGLLAMLAAWLTRAPVRVYTIFGLVHTARSGFARLLMLWTEKTSCALAHTVICECESIRDIAITDRVCSAGKLKVIPAWSLNSAADIQQRNHEKARHRAEVRARLGIGRMRW